ncbi:glycosyltransferase family 4 protein [Pseudoxanthomonas sp. F37]|uniref:glycosyltransferase family 4 protein n=1 Tax=Pseudoxanthomonas TaxID=83618 RepID=UPI001FD40F11|nr:MULTISPECIES: glycosyltransferase family 4 protein [Pseudoxanthomonas]UOV06589.1 glycosyltransferase family 4 protein [Pseudoxanthomonas mexicana]UOV08196.1 glycosyltransferase family 4 protein [Pseudoxanthomonas sp. F37]
MTPVAPRTSADKRYLMRLVSRLARSAIWRTLYRHVPTPWREKLARWVGSRMAGDLAFARTERWNASVRTRDRGDTSLNASQTASHSKEGGVNIVAFASGPLGLGESARLYTRALIERGYPVAVQDVPLPAPASQQDDSLAKYAARAPMHDIDLVFVNPDYLEQALSWVGRADTPRRYTVACWFWELERFPDEWHSSLSMADEFLVASAFIRDLLVGVTKKPVLKVPLPLFPATDSGLARRDFGLREDAFLFLTTFDFNSSFWRKNPLGVIAAFQAAFPDPATPVQLVIKSVNGSGYSQLLSQLLQAAAADERILVRDDLIQKPHLQALQRCADAYVSLHRAEGFGLGMAESMALGKPVVATAWSGNMEFMSEQNSYLVPATLVPVLAGQYPHADGQRWAEPDIGRAAILMREVVADPATAKARGLRAQSDVRSRLSGDAVGTALMGHLQAIQERIQSPCE